MRPRGWKGESCMTRRQSIRQAALLGFGLALGKLDLLKASGGQLTVDLSQWGTVVFKLQGKVVTVKVQEVFDALAGGQ